MRGLVPSISVFRQRTRCCLDARAEALKAGASHVHGKAPRSGRGIWVGSVDWFRYPLPPNRTCRFPASGSPFGGLTREGLSVQRYEVSYKLRGSRLVGPSASVPSGPAVRPALISVRTLSGGFSHKAILSVSFRMGRTSRLHLPAPLRSPGITRLHRYYECSD